MNNRTKDFLSVVLASCVCFAVPATGGVHYVNQATGHDTEGCGATAASACASFQFAVYQSRPGDIWDIYNGTYGPVQINHSGTPGAYITFQAAPGQHPVILKTAAEYNGISIEDNQSYITLQGLKVVGNAQSVTLAQANASDNTNSTTNGNCIGVPKTAHHINIVNNDLSLCPGAGIIYWGDYGVIRGNSVYENSYWSRNAESGIVIVGSPIANLTPGTIQVYDNFVYSNEHLSCNLGTGGPGQQACVVTDGQGIIVDSNGNTALSGCGVGTNYQGHIAIYNNISWNNGGWGLVIHCSQNVSMYNNTTWANGTTTSMQPPYTSSTGGELGFNHSANIKIENNIFVGNVASGLMWGTSNTNYVFDYNTYFQALPGGDFYFLNGVYGYTPIGPHDQIANPLVVGGYPPPAYFKLSASSPAIGTGTPSLVPPADFANVPRNPSQPDRGAYGYPN